MLRLRDVRPVANARPRKVHADRLDLEERHPGPHVGLRRAARGRPSGPAGLCEADRFHPGLLRLQARQYTGGGMRLQGRIAAITGGALGIGRATARLFAAEGATVALGDVDVAGAEAVAKEIVAGGGRAMAVGMDVGDPGQVRDFVDRVVTELGRLDVMFANARTAPSAPFLDHSEP